MGMKLQRRSLLTLALILAALSPFSASAKTEITGTDLLTNKSVTVTNDAGKKGLVVVFLSAICPCSNSHVSEINSLSEEFKDFTFIGVHSNSEEELKMSTDYFKEVNLKFPIIQDVKYGLANKYKALKTPHVFIINSSDQILYQGAVSDSRQFPDAKEKLLRESLKALQKGQKISNPKTRPLGCVISRS